MTTPRATQWVAELDAALNRSNYVVISAEKSGDIHHRLFSVTPTTVGTLMHVACYRVNPLDDTAVYYRKNAEEIIASIKARGCTITNIRTTPHHTAPREEA